MNTIDYRSIDENGLSFELLIDGWPFGELIGVPNASIPVWLFENDLPSYSSFDSPGQDDETRIIAVCGCGEYGCGRSLCRVVREGDDVVFCDFEGDLGSEESLKEFQFSSVNYDSVISKIVNEANGYKGRT